MAKYPGKTPQAMKDVLFPLSKDIAHDFGREVGAKSLIVTDELMEVVVLTILGSLSVAAHAALQERERLIADEAVKQWADAPATEYKPK